MWLLFLFFFFPSFAWGAQPNPAGTQTLTSVVGNQWPGVRFLASLDPIAVEADPTLVITISFSISPDNKTFRTISTSHIIGGVPLTPRGSLAGNFLLNYPVPDGYYARLSVTHNKDLVFNLSMGAK